MNYSNVVWYFSDKFTFSKLSLIIIVSLTSLLTSDIVTMVIRTSMISPPSIGLGGGTRKWPLSIVIL